jgi:hypothetical protein
MKVKGPSASTLQGFMIEGDKQSLTGEFLF